MTVLISGEVFFFVHFVTVIVHFQCWQLACDTPRNADNNPSSGTHKWVRAAFLPDAVISFQCFSPPVAWHGAILPVWHGCCLETMPLWGVWSLHSHRGTTSKWSRSEGHVARQEAPKDTIITQLETSGCCHRLDKGLALWEKKQFSLQVKCDNEHNCFSSPLSPPQWGFFI